jgi:hypothetical protein
MANNVPYVEKVLVTKGDLGFVANGTALYSFLNEKDFRGKLIYNVAPGQPVAWVDKKDGTIPLTVTPATLVVTDLPFLHIGVGYDGDNDGITEAIRQFGPDHAEACAITDFNAFGPQCGLSEIKAIYPSCLSCETLTMKVTVNDSFTRSFANAGWPNEAATFVGSYTPDCATCGDCEKTVSCDEYMCGLVDDLNGDRTYKVAGEYYPDYFNDTIKRPFRAVKLHENWFSYCLVPANSTCVNCNKIDDLTTFTVGTGGTEEVVNFVGVKNPADNTQTLISQLSYAAQQIENKIQAKYGKHGGWAVLSRGVGNCCGVQLHVVTCDPDFTIAGLSACENAIDPAGEFTVTGVCEQCDSTSTPDNRSCGIAIIADQDTLDCDCFLEFPPANLLRNITIDVVSTGNLAKYAKKKTLQEGKVASGFGAEVQLEEYRQVAGYSGYNYSNGNNPRGNLGLPSKDSRIRKAVTAKCDTSYCTYEFGGRFQREFGAADNPVNRIIKTKVYTPEGDSTTKTAIEALALKLATLGAGTCKLLTAYGCDGNALED